MENSSRKVRGHGMNWSEIPLIDYIDIYEDQVDVYIHTKDQRVIGVKDVQTNGHLDAVGFTVDHMAFGLKFTFFMPREDFSHIEYRYIPRENNKKYFDDLHSYLDEDVYPPEPGEALKEP
jgi:hypothetical protein